MQSRDKTEERGDEEEKSLQALPHTKPLQLPPAKTGGKISWKGRCKKGGAFFRTPPSNKEYFFLPIFGLISVRQCFKTVDAQSALCPLSPLPPVVHPAASEVFFYER